MRNQWRFYGKMFVVCSLLGAFTVSLPSEAAAKRVHDPQVETKTEMSRSIPAGMTEEEWRRLPLGERIEAILHPKEEIVPEADPEPIRQMVQVPITESAYDEAIVGTPLASQEQCVKYLLRRNPYPNISVSPEQLVSYYYEEGQREGIRPDVAFAQALKETGFFSYGGTVTPDNNYCGLGTTSATVKGAYFPSSKMGVRAHIQHLLAYASTRKPVEPVVDPRYTLVRSTYGEQTLGNWQDLNGRWAVPGHSYGQSIMSMFRAMLQE